MELMTEVEWAAYDERWRKRWYEEKLAEAVQRGEAMSKKKLFGSLAKIAIGFIPGGGAVVEAAKLGGELVVGELLLKDDDEKREYRGWYHLAAKLRDNEKLTNGRRKALLLGRIESDLVGETGEEPGETDLMFYFYMVVRDVKGGFEEEEG